MNDMPQLSVVVPVHNEEDNVAPLVGEIVAALRGTIDFEIVYVDDTSRDATLARLRELQATTPELRVIRHLSNAGQSTAVRNGVKAARAPWIATLDGDGQNDPADIPKLLEQRDAAAPDIEGSLDEGSFIAYYMDAGRVAAAAGVWRDEEMARLQAEMDRGVVVRR